RPLDLRFDEPIGLVAGGSVEEGEVDPSCRDRARGAGDRLRVTRPQPKTSPAREVAAFVESRPGEKPPGVFEVFNSDQLDPGWLADRPQGTARYRAAFRAQPRERHRFGGDPLDFDVRRLLPAQQDPPRRDRTRDESWRRSEIDLSDGC